MKTKLCVAAGIGSVLLLVAYFNPYVLFSSDPTEQSRQDLMKSQGLLNYEKSNIPGLEVKTPAKVIGDKQTTSNLRYKHGRNLNFEPRDVLAFRNPKEAGLPVPTVNSSYIFAGEDTFLCYPNNYNHYVNYYRNTFQHGGVSLEEMIVPVIKMVTK